MEGDAGAGRLNPSPMPTNRRLRRRNRTFRPKSSQESEGVTDQTNPEVTAGDSAESDVGADQTNPEVTAEDTAESDVGADQTNPEVTADDSAEPEVGADQSNPVVTAEDSSESDVVTDQKILPVTPGDPSEPEAEPAQETPEPTTGDSPESEAAAPVDRGRSRLGRGWLAGIAAALVLCAAAIGAGGYFALRFHQEAQTIARDDAAALKAAVECVAATQAPDTNAMSASEQKIIDCGTDAFRSQALIYTSMIVQAYQAANVHVQVSDARAAVERNNSDGSVDVLVALRVKVASGQSQNETGYRLRVKMALADGQYKISKLDQVTK